ncbi:MAG: SDR family NAD(P)-dependent oxidoreductase, partial [Sphingomonas sp.]
MNLDIAGKIALVTGADSGMGKETARMLLQEGVRVAITDQPGGDLAKSVEDLKALGEVIAVEADLTRLDDVKALFA